MMAVFYLMCLQLNLITLEWHQTNNELRLIAETLFQKKFSKKSTGKFKNQKYVNKVNNDA